MKLLQIKKNVFGVTEFLGKKLGVLGKEVMLIYNKELSVAPITTHIELKKVSNSLSKRKIIEKLITINNFYLKIFNIKPKIGLLGLNPHNNELRSDSEEKKIMQWSKNWLKIALFQTSTVKKRVLCSF